MSRQRKYLEIDVLEAARERIRHVFDVFDSVVVMFSGGKDSLVALHLVAEIADELGALPVNVVFRDEELIPRSVIELVDHYRQQPWVRMLWYAVPLHSQLFVLGDVREYIQWDPARPHVREIPPWAITTPVGEAPGTVFSQYQMDQLVARNFKGRIAAVTGIRASESLVRYRSSVNKLNENYITKSDTGLKGTPGAARLRAVNLMLAKPIFDWEEDDVLQYIYEHHLRYAPAYDAQHLAGVGLRVSTPLHPEAAKRFGKLRETEPDLYAACIAIWPDMTHEQSQRLAFRRLDEVETMAERRPESWPTAYVLNAFVTGAFKRVLQPLKPKAELTPTAGAGGAVTGRNAPETSPSMAEVDRPGDGALSAPGGIHA